MHSSKENKFRECVSLDGPWMKGQLMVHDKSTNSRLVHDDRPRETIQTDCEQRRCSVLIHHTRPKGGRPSKKGLDDLLTFQGHLSHTSLGRAPYSAQNIMIKVLYHKLFPNNGYKEQVHVTSITVMEVTSESSELLNNRSNC